MGVIRPNSDVILLKVPLEISNDNQLTFSNATAQFNYFNGLANKLELDKYSYQRKDNTIRIGMLVDDLYDYNYVMYRNANHDSKWYYAYIIGCEYISDSVTAVKIKTDVWQTYQFDLNYKPVFVEREHVNDDTFGLHTIPENLETGEFVRGLTGDECNYNNNFWLVFQVTELISNMGDAGVGTHRLYNGIYNGLFAVLIDDYTTADLLVKAYDQAGKADAIIACFYVPKNTVTSYVINSNVTLAGQTCTIYFPNATTSASTIDSLSVSKPTDLDGYTPKNNKMFTGEYCYMLASNNAGSEAIFNFEDFRNPSTGSVDLPATFIVRATLTQGGGIRMYPANTYKCTKGTASYTSFNSVAKYGLTGGKLPICSWNSDYYTNWLTQNAINMPLNTISGIIGTAARVASGSIGGAATSIIDTISNTVGKTYQAQLVPNQAKGNTNCGDTNFSEGLHLTVTTMTIRKEYAKMIDDYFSMFGYKVSAVKIPNITGRVNWNYVKTVGCYIQADIPQEDLAEIKSMFDNGITFWHNPATFADYSQNNGIVI